MIFGGIHCLGWNYSFQAHKQQILWRVASVGITCPLLLLHCILLIMSTGSTSILLYLGVCLCTCFYLFSRITIFVLMFLSLRSLPPGAYDTVARTKFIPHA
ncbi:hypothetical protein EDD22DRAFT_808277, partial [Suillus occidentalis]